MSKLQKWLLNRIHREEKVILSSSRIYILPTREGVMFSLLLFTLLAAAVNFNNSLVFFFTFLMAGVGIISMHMTQYNLLNLQFSIAHVKPVFCNQIVNLPLTIQQQNHPAAKSSPTKYSIAVQLIDDSSSKPSAPSLSLLADVIDNDKSILLLHSPALQRGHFAASALTVSSRYPLGLFRAWANIKLDCNAIVYPEPIKKISYEPKNGCGSDGHSAKGRGFDDFSGLKNYQSGESLKHIHWKAYAKEQGLLCKTFSGSNNQQYWLDFNELSGDVEARLSQLCYLIIKAEQCGDRYGLKLGHKNISINHGQTHQHQCLKALALYQ